VASEWPKVVPKTRALPKPLTQVIGQDLPSASLTEVASGVASDYIFSMT